MELSLAVLGLLLSLHLGPQRRYILRNTDDFVEFLLPGTRSDTPQVDHVARDAQHRGEGGEPAERVRPPRVLVVHILDRLPLHQVEDEDADTDSRRKSDPAELPPDGRVIANHLLDAIVEAVHAKRPGYGDTFEEDQEQQAEAGDSVRVEDLEDVHATLRNTRQSNQIRDDTSDGDEDLLPPPEEFGPLVDDRSDKPFHGAELAVQPDEQ